MLLAANVQGGKAVFERAEVLTQTEASSETSIKKRFAEIVRADKLGKAETIVVLSRNDVEVRPMVFPPVPPEELPDLVRFQASKEFNGYDPNAPVDFFITNKLDNVSRSTLFPAIREGRDKSKGKEKSGREAKSPTASAGAPKHILASTIRTATLGKIRQFCDELGLNLRHITLRPCETAYLWRQSERFDPNRCVLLVELDATETSQAVLYLGEPVFMRSPKIGCPEDVSSSDFAARLIAELKRTRIAVRNEIEGVTVDEVVLCGVGKNHEILAKNVAQGLGIPVLTFDPWQNVSMSDDLKKLEKSERFASLIGSLHQRARGLSSEIDFCNPKKRPESTGQKQLLTGGLAVAFCVVLFLMVFGFLSQSALTKEVRTLQNKVNGLQKTSKTVAEQRTQLAEIDRWLADDVNWFEQLVWLSRQAPSAQELVLNELTMTANNGGTMALKSLLKDSSIVSPMEERLRDEHHDLKTGEKGEVRGNPNYAFRYNLSIVLSRGELRVQSGE